MVHSTVNYICSEEVEIPPHLSLNASTIDILPYLRVECSVAYIKSFEVWSNL